MKNSLKILITCKIYLIKSLFITTLLITLSCTNPFAPKIVDSITDGILSDQMTIEGVFDNFRYAYMFKDTVVYGRLLSDDFVFVFRNYDKGVDVSWGRNEDMISTHRLFNATQNIELIWNNVLTPSGDSLLVEVSRGFTLTIIFNPADIVRIQGRAVFRLRRNDVNSPWLIVMWRDESNY